MSVTEAGDKGRSWKVLGMIERYLSYSAGDKPM